MATATKSVTPVTAPAVTPPASSPAPMETEHVRKITSKIFKSIAIGKEHGVKIAGIIRAVKKKPSVLDSSQEYCEFSGDFRLMYDGKLYVSNKLILPAYPESVLENEYAKSFESGDINPSATFGIVIYRKDDSGNAKNARGFTWELAQIRAVQTVSVENDPLLKLMS